MLQNFIRLYQNSIDINNLKEIKDVNYRCFLKKKGFPVSLVKTKDKSNLKEMQSLTIFHKFFRDNKHFWMVPITTISSKIVGFILRGYEFKNYRMVYDFQNKISPMFGWECFNNFNLDEPIILTEGVKDTIYLQQFYPYVLSLNTSGITSLNLEILKNLSDKIILCYDNDDTGNKSLKSDKSLLKNKNISFDVLKPPLKDCAELLENKKEEETFLSNMKIKLKLFGGNLWN